MINKIELWWDSNHFWLDHGLFEKKTKRHDAVVVVDRALEQEIQRLNDLLADYVILISGLFGHEQADYFVEIFCYEIDEIHLVLFFNFSILVLICVPFSLDWTKRETDKWRIK